MDFKQIAVVGAAGKMGRGISLLLLFELAKSSHDPFFKLTLIDTDPKALEELEEYLKEQLPRYAEKHFVKVRQDALAGLRTSVSLRDADGSDAIFEAVVEDADVKAKIFSDLSSRTGKKPYFFTNTSAIPISVLNEKAGLEGHIIGFHFYNPPPVQKLLEIIPAKETVKELVDFAKELAKRLEKIPVISNDVAGFIGNGHFVREIDFACRKVKKLEKSCSFREAVWMLDCVTRDFLIRPMGIFQLLDYVGLDVCRKVIGVMQRHLGISFETDLLERYLKDGCLGGQLKDGSQKEGIFQYEKGAIQAMWDGAGYAALPSDCLGALPDGHEPWKKLHRDQEKERALSRYFKHLAASNTLGARLAREYLEHSGKIAEGLVQDGVAGSLEDVYRVLQYGFYHLYGKTPL